MRNIVSQKRSNDCFNRRLNRRLNRRFNSRPNRQFNCLPNKRSNMVSSTRQKNWPNQQRGVTILELMVAVCLSALLLGFAVPSMSDFVANQRITAATNEMVANLQYARMQAVTRRHNVVACPSVDQQRCFGNRWDSGWIVFNDADNNRQVDASEDLLRVVAADERAQISSGGRFRVRFQPSGGAYGSNLTLRICANGSEVDGRAVIVSNPGRVRVEHRIANAECVL